MSKFCSRCGKSLNDAAMFCDNCGQATTLSEPISTNTQNIYVPDVGIKENFFSYKKRLNRERYFKRVLLTMSANALALVIEGHANGILSNPHADAGLGMIVLALAAFIISVVALVSSTMLHIRRLHDLDSSGWWAITTLIPIICLIPLGVLLFTKGTDGDNRFGTDPLQ